MEIKINNIKEFTKGWFIGDFTPTLLKTNDFEVAIKYYKAGDQEERHHHKLATEYTVVVSGEISMNGEKFIKDEIITILPNEKVVFKCLTDAITVVIKTPSIKGDKYIG